MPSKGIGARGGHVIGYTKSGKPIYGAPADRKEAAESKVKEYTSYVGEGLGAGVAIGVGEHIAGALKGHGHALGKGGAKLASKVAKKSTKTGIALAKKGGKVALKGSKVTIARAGIKALSGKGVAIAAGAVGFGLAAYGTKKLLSKIQSKK